ncbi:MAG: large repetitive protein, partial [Actinomycetota bacterium]|nr:large repetitive protein [Actinomycetota bacterium]
GRSISDYYAAIFTGDPPTCGVTGDLPGTPDVPADSSSFKYMDTSTSTTFTGLTANTTYSFAVFAFNGMGCTRSAIVQATPRVPPGTVTGIATSGPDANGSSTWDFRVTDVSIANGPSDTDSFMYRLSGGNVEGGEHGPLQFGDFLVASNGSQYGEDISVQVKACKTYPEGTVCSQDWSNTKHLGVPVNNSVPRGLSFTHDPYGGIGDPPTPGAWSWDASPDYPNVTYSCGDGENQLDNGAGGSCEVTETRLFSHDFPNLNITITANGTTYVRTYDWHDYN